MFRQRTEDRGPIRRYRKGRSDVKRHASSSPAKASNADAGIGSGPAAITTPSSDAGMGSPAGLTPSGIPVTGSPILPAPASVEAQLISDVAGSRVRTVVIAGIFVVCIAAVAIPLIAVGNTIRSVSQAVFAKPGPTPTVAHGSPAPSPPAKHPSYLTAAGARSGLAQLAGLAPGARLSLIRIDATSITATAQLTSGASKLLVIGPTGKFALPTAPTGERPIPLSQIRPAVVAKLVAQMRSRFHVPAARIDYMVLNSAPGLPVHWILFSKAPSHSGFTANLNGTHLARIPG